MAMCTNMLAIMVLERRESMSTVIEKLEEGLNGELLIDRWKIQINTIINSSSKKHELMQREFYQYKLQDHNFNIEETAEKLIEEW